ncbi:hypothetical protein AHAS_Ahas19G0172300 [Arachis hypogaea]
MADRKGKGKATSSGKRKRTSQSADTSDAAFNARRRELPTVNESWVKEFYANYYTGALDAVYLRGQQILVIEETIEHALHLELGPSGKDAYEEAEGDRHMKTFDWDQVLAVIAEPGSRTLETRVIADMAVMVWCVLEGRELHLPRHIRRSMGRPHYVGNLAFPCLITQLATEAGVLWMTTDQRPTVAGHKKITPHGD